MSSNNRYKLENNSDLETINSFKNLISNIKALKDKTWGCPWQKIQSHVSLIPFLYEESNEFIDCLLYTSPSPRDGLLSRMPSSA